MSGFKSERWIEVGVELPPDAVEAISAYLFERESLGITEEEAGMGPGGPVRLRAYFESDPLERDRAAFEEGLRAALDQAGSGEAPVRIEEVLYGDWAEGWKKYFKPRKIGERLVVAPTWEAYQPAQGELVVRVDPGMAFGTGQHETTSLCLKALEEAVPSRPGTRVLDVGTGSGILAIAAVLLGAAETLGLDNDPEAVRAARENVAANDLGDRVRIEETPVEEVREVYPVVVANIMAEPLIALAPAIASRVAPGGILILSGILAHLAPGVVESYRARGFPEADIRRDGDWVCLVAGKA